MYSSKVVKSNDRQEKDLIKLTQLLRDESKNSFLIGDEIAFLTEQRGWLITNLAKRFGKTRSRLSQIYHTAKLFSPEKRNYSAHFSRFEFAYKTSKKFPKLTIEHILDEIQKNNLATSRKVTSHFAKIERAKDNSKSAELAAFRKLGLENTINHCHYKDCREIAKTLKDKSLKICFFDAPYGDYGSYRNGKHTQGGAALNQFDNGKTENVIQLINDMFAILAEKLTDDGVILLCRPGGIPDPLHIIITKAADDNYLNISNIQIWHKGGAKLWTGTEPYTCDIETIWVINRKGQEIINHDNSSRSNVLSFAPVRQKSISAEDSHLFIKPQDLCDFLIKKHSYEGEVLLDACGCSGNFSIAAYQANRQFIYCETNLKNFDMGSRRIFKAMEKGKANVG